ncbi:MAG TPA: GIY-YIG nuclease family protein [Dehalococcoidia bacterium]|nr:GIY-YIG nuclease family protein [Dehalococcoidia bacterium]
MKPARGTYALILALDKDSAITVGKLTKFSFPAGYYLYAGSALGGLFPRVRRHIKGGNKLHWHIDYLRREARVVEVWYLVSDESLECRWYQAAAGISQAKVPVAGFGSSGCGCVSHLVYFPTAPSFTEFRRRLGDSGRDVRKMSVEWGEMP